MATRRPFIWITGARDEFVSKESLPYFIQRIVSMGAHAVEFDLDHKELQTVFGQHLDVPPYLVEFIRWLNTWIEYNVSQPRAPAPITNDMIYTC